jgi:hypothetical protein
MTKNNLFFINYSDHPAYIKLAESPTDNQIIQIFNEIDIAFEESQKLNSDQFLSNILNSNVQKLKEIINLQMSNSDVFFPIVLKTIDNFHNEIMKEHRYLSLQKLKNFKPNKDKTIQDFSNQLKEQGFYTTHLPDENIQKIWDSSKMHREQLIELRKQKPQKMASCAIPLPQEGELWKSFYKAVKESKMIEVVDEFTKSGLELDYYCLQLSHDDEAWWKNCYSDVGLPTSQTAYMHFDEDYCLIKAIMYLQPVGEHNSPFSIIPKNKYENHYSYSREVFFKKLDYATSSSIPPEYKSPYYRRQFKNEDLRKAFMKIPAPLRGSSHFGDDILDGTEASEWLLKNEIKITSDVGNCVVFAGGKAIHRGGMVEKGERWVIQIGFRQKDMSFKGKITKMRRMGKRLLPTSINNILRFIFRFT